MLNKLFAVSVDANTLGLPKVQANDATWANIIEAKDTILYAIIGLVTSMLAFTGVQFVIGRF